MVNDAAQLKPPVSRNYVTSDDEVSAWRDVVVVDQDIDSYTRVILMSLPIFLDDDWRIAVTLDEYVEQTGRSRNLAEEYLPKAVESQYVERITDGDDSAVRLCFPD